METKKIKITQQVISMELANEPDMLEYFDSMEEYWTFDIDGERDGSKILTDGISQESGPRDTNLRLTKGMIIELPRRFAIHLVKTGDAIQYFEPDPEFEGKGIEEPNPQIPKEVLTDQGDANADIEKEVAAAMGKKESGKGKKK